MRYASILFACLACQAHVSVLAWHNDNARTGQSLKETILTPAKARTSARAPSQEYFQLSTLVSCFLRALAIQNRGRKGRRPLDY